MPDTPRFKLWCCLLGFSAVCVASLVSSGASDSGVKKWVLAAICISLIFSFGGVNGYIFIQDKFEGRVEGIFAILLLIFWIGSLPCIMDPNANIAVTRFVIVNANLYFFSWTSFIASTFLFVQAIDDVIGKDVVSKATPKILKLVGSFVTSIVVTAAASQFHSGACALSSSMCSRNAYAISVGVLGMLISGTSIGLVAFNKMTLLIELCLSSLIFFFYIFAVGFVTFGDGPAAQFVSNLYFSIWIGFVLCLLLSIDSFKDYMTGHSGGDKDAKATPTTSPEVVGNKLSVVEEGKSEDLEEC